MEFYLLNIRIGMGVFRKLFEDIDAGSYIIHIRFISEYVCINGGRKNQIVDRARQLNRNLLLEIQREREITVSVGIQY
jgi:hypothetical protein